MILNWIDLIRRGIAVLLVINLPPAIRYWFITSISASHVTGKFTERAMKQRW
jgi:hypothetical protein